LAAVLLSETASKTEEAWLKGVDPVTFQPLNPLFSKFLDGHPSTAALFGTEVLEWYFIQNGVTGTTQLR